LVNFLLILESVVEYSKNEIDKGETPKEIYELCSCIRETFCLSYSIRKNNNLYIYFQEEHLLLSFVGKKLRYLGPDERSQALLLLKAINKGKSFTPKDDPLFLQSTPGIYCTKFLDSLSSIDYMIMIINEGNVYLIIDEIVPIQEFSRLDNILEEIYENDLYIIPSKLRSTQNSGFMVRLKDMKNINFLSLSKIKSLENKILYINFRKDHQETL
jgi:hypothetical protein